MPAALASSTDKASDCDSGQFWANQCGNANKAVAPKPWPCRAWSMRMAVMMTAAGIAQSGALDLRLSSKNPTMCACASIARPATSSWLSARQCAIARSTVPAYSDCCALMSSWRTASRSSSVRCCQRLNTSGKLAICVVLCFARLFAQLH